MRDRDVIAVSQYHRRDLLKASSSKLVILARKNTTYRIFRSTSDSSAPATQRTPPRPAAFPNHPNPRPWLLELVISSRDLISWTLVAGTATQSTSIAIAFIKASWTYRYVHDILQYLNRNIDVYHRLRTEFDANFTSSLEIEKIHTIP